METVFHFNCGIVCAWKDRFVLTFILFSLALEPLTLAVITAGSTMAAWKKTVSLNFVDGGKFGPSCSKITEAFSPWRQNIFYIKKNSSKVHCHSEPGICPTVIGTSITSCQDSIMLHVSGTTFLSFSFGTWSNPWLWGIWASAWLRRGYN